MRIVVDARGLRTSTGRYDERLLHHLQAVDTENDYVVLLRSKDVPGWQPTNPRVTVVPSDVDDFSFAEQFALLRQLRRLRPDLVHFLRPQQPWLYRGAKVTTVHDLTMLRFRNPYRNRLEWAVKRTIFSRLVTRVVRTSAAVIVPTEFVRRDVVAHTGVDPERITVTPYAADPIPDDAVPVTALVDRRFLLSVANPQPHKNLRRLVDAFAGLHAGDPALLLVLVGRQDDPAWGAIREEIDAKGLTDAVVLTGFVTDGQLRWLYERTLAVVVPSLSEGFGLTGLEAMHGGAPVASSSATCLPEVYGDGAVYFDPHDSEALAAVLAALLHDPERRAELVERGRARVGRYSWESTARQTLRVYEQAAMRVTRDAGGRT